MDILTVLREHYPIKFDKLKMMREAGSTSYAVTGSGKKYFLRSVKPAFRDTADAGVGIHVFLQNQEFPVPPVIH